ncbi:helix-turn-helix domain-containing protein, partial [Streptomyces sp. NPDC086549]|uniref:helix-turn-helix domain-containing protein n=1 Tax=Streptomyces sp. NPDC086549 TaxID=3365752 RepID=UPI00381FF955
MRYAQGGGLTDAGRAARERLRLQAMERFEGGEKNREIAAALRVSERSVARWRRAWRERGEIGVRSKGSSGCPKLSPTQIARLEGVNPLASWRSFKRPIPRRGRPGVLVRSRSGSG